MKNNSNEITRNIEERNKMNALVYGQSGYFSEVVVGMGSNGADAIGAEGSCFWFFLVYFAEAFLAVQNHFNSSFIWVQN